MKSPSRLHRLAVILALWLPVLAEIAWGMHSERFMYLDAKSDIVQLARQSAQTEAQLVGLRLTQQFYELFFVANTLIGPKHSQTLGTQTKQLLQRYSAQHSQFFVLDVLSPDGSRIVWSTHKQSDRPIAVESGVTPVRAHPQFLLGQDQFAKRAGGHVITMGYRMTDAHGRALYLIGSPFRIDDLLANQEASPFTLSVRDMRDSSLLGVWEHGEARYPHTAPQSTVSVPVPDMPLAVQASWPQALVWKRYEQQGLASRLAARGVVLGVLSAAAIMIGLLMRRRERQTTQIARLLAFNSMLAQVNHTIAEAQDERDLLQNVCSFAVKYAGTALAWIGRPDMTGTFQFLAAAGPEQGYLEGIVISIDPAIPEGQGSTGRAWREGQTYFDTGFAQSPFLQPWRDRAMHFGMQARATLPIRRGGQVWAVMTLYARERDLFDGALRNLLRELAHNVSRGLDHIDLVHRERDASAFNMALLESLTAGVIVMRYPDRAIERVNTRLLQLAGASSLEELLGHSAPQFHADDTTYSRVNEFAEEVLRDGQGIMRDLPYCRLDGQVIYMDISGQLLDVEDGVHRIVWTHVDVTERHENEASIRTLSAMRATLLANTVAGISLVRYPERVFVEVNQGFLDIMGYSSANELVGRKTCDIYTTAAESQRMAAIAQEVLSEGGANLRDLEVRRKDGQIVYVDVHGRRLDKDEPQHPVIIWTSVDVTERHTLTHELTRQAQFDELTGLPNRRALEQHLVMAIAKAKRHGTLLAVGMIDLDDFKPVNDRFGHKAGDELLRQLGTRLQSRLRASDFIARLGGDEFVVVIEDLEKVLALQQLGIVLERLHKEVELPIDLGEECKAKVDMSMGLAIYPLDAEQPEALLRLADAAMYQAKAHKSVRAQWWSLRPTQIGDMADGAPLDPFGEEARQLLGNIQEHLDAVIKEFVEIFDTGLAQQPELVAIATCLAPGEFSALTARRVDYLRFLLKPEATEQEILERAAQLGQAHALTGVSKAWMSQTMILYRDLLRRHLGAMPHIVCNQYRVLQVVDMRLQLQIEAVLDAMQAVGDAYNAHLARPLPAIVTSWEGLCQAELEALGRLPGIRACELLRPHANGVFAVEFSAGEMGHEIDRISRKPGMQPQLDVRSPSGHGCISRAWRTEAIQYTDAYAMDTRTQVWHTAFEELGIRSVVAIPVGSKDAMDFVLAIQGAYPRQFAASWAHTFVASLQNHWGQIAEKTRPRAALVSQEDAAAYRQHLYSGGLAMFVQPILDLRAGSVIRAEALARLVMPDGKVIAPGIFMPTLRDADIEALFRMGLDQALEHLRAWDHEGLNIGLSINLSPSTLVQPDCALWVEEALQRHKVAPHRLTLELLETQEFEEKLKDQAIQNLLNTGIRLAIDDLGSGYSSFRRLASYEFDVIKVDQSLMKEMTRDPVKILSLVRTIVQIGRDFEREVVVEGVETTAAIEAVGIMGAQFGQGYGISPPIPGADLPRWVHGQTWSSIDRRALHSFLGALAYHWNLTHQYSNRHLIDHDDCLLTSFFRGNGLHGCEAERWHLQIHEAEENASSGQEASRRLMDWLVEHAKRENHVATDRERLK